MKSLLILGGGYDMETLIVKWGLLALGHPGPSLLSWYDFPYKASSSIYVSTMDADGFDFISSAHTVRPPFDTIWYRRPGSPTVHPQLAEVDQPFAQSESNEYVRNAAFFLDAKETLWVNNPFAADKARNKAVQLRVARDVGLNFPNTLISNDPVAVQKFYHSNGRDIIYKPFNPASWIVNSGSQQKTLILPTTILTENDIGEAESIASSPAIYQQRIEVSSEIRAMVIGDQVISCEILSQASSKTVDWRPGLSQGKIEIRPYTLPDDTSSRCVRLCRHLSLAFGCIDLIKTHQGEYVFLEINESGQFLWVEERLPDLPILDTFCRFLLGNTYCSHLPRIRLDEYLASDVRNGDKAEADRENQENTGLMAKSRFYYE